MLAIETADDGTMQKFLVAGTTLPGGAAPTPGALARTKRAIDQVWRKAKKIRGRRLRREGRSWGGGGPFTGFTYEELQSLAAVLRYPHTGNLN